MNAKRWVAALVLGGAVCLTSGGRVWGDDTELPLQDKPPSESPLAQEPQTPEELFDATLFMLKLGKLDLARYYIEKLVAADPDDLTLLRMRDKHDTAIFLEIMRVDEIAKPADWLAKRLQEATRNHVADAGYFPAILAKLSAGGREQAEAIDELRYLGSYAIPPMLSELQNPQRTDKGLLLFAMTRLGKDAVEPLVGALLSPAADVRASAAEVLGVVGGEEEQVWLQRMAFSPAEPESSQHAAKAALARLAYGDPAKTNRLSGYGASDRLTRLAIGYLDGPTNGRKTCKKMDCAGCGLGMPRQAL